MDCKRYINNGNNVVGEADLPYANLNLGSFGNKADLHAIMAVHQ
jgi:hypothetical protein